MRFAAKGALAFVLAIAIVIAAPGPLPGADASPDNAEARKKGGKKRKPRPAVKPRLLPFPSCDSLVGYADHQATRLYGRNYRPTNASGTVGLPQAAGAESGPVRNDKQVSADTSQTNVQEQGVDEPDIVKTDGNRIFAIAGNSLRAVDARAARPSLLGSLPLEGSAHELLLVGNRLLVLSRDLEVPPSVDPAPDPGDPPPPQGLTTSELYESSTTLLSEVDVSNPGAMQIVSRQRFDGGYVSARLTGDVARVVLSSPPAALEVPANKLRSPLAGWVPYSSFEDRRTGATSTEPALGSCPEIARPGAFSGLDMLSVLTIDMARGLPAIDTDAVMTDALNVYASTGSLYVSTERWAGRFHPEDPSRAATAIHKFDISNPTGTEYLASGTVRGALLNQFSMSEHNGFLRVASTGDAIGKGDEGGTESFVSVLDQRAANLVRVGRVGNLGLGEEIRGVRMVGDNGYVVTFRQIDPLYTLDLSSPANPRVLGELKILGYSAYLHPISDNLLIGVGADATSEGSITGAQVSLFDVSNLNQPKRVSQQTIPGGYSSVEDTHLAFLYWPPSKLAVIPVSVRRGKGAFTGALGFRIDRQAIGRTGRITHRARGREEAIQRSLVVGGRLFTLSCSGVKVTAMAGFRAQGWLRFPSVGPRGCRPAQPLAFE